ncbi:MAG: hypothetical protein KC620_12510 [Myxococcales bacterium]|nr:hypothetical protein [Myxococcales bacterium]
MHVRTVDQDGEYVLQDGAPQEYVEQPEWAVERVSALFVGGAPWVAFGAEGQRIVVFQAERPQLTRIELDIVGRPLLAAAGTDLMVIGQSPDGGVAWQIVDGRLEVTDPIVDDSGLPRPDDAAGTRIGVILRFAAAQQCVLISDADWQPAGNLPCTGNDGRLISTGDQAFYTLRQKQGVADFVAVRDLFGDPDAPFLTSGFVTTDLMRYQNDSARRPVVGSARIGANRNKLILQLIGVEGLWESIKGWDTRFDADWPFERTRAIAQRTLPARARPGRCGAPARTCGVEGAEACPAGFDCVNNRCLNANACDAANACAEGLECVGAVGPVQALLFVWDRLGRPVVRFQPLAARSFNGSVYDIDINPACTPVPEICDELDQDCDSRADDGVCCAYQVGGIDERFGTVLRATQFLFTPVRGRDAFKVVWRMPDNDTWNGKVFFTPRVQVPRDLAEFTDIHAVHAAEGIAVVAPGGITGLLAHAPDNGGEPGPITFFWRHASRGDTGQDPPKETDPLPCNAVLAVEVLDHDVPRESAVVVCEDKIIRAFAVQGHENIIYDMNALGLANGITFNWATALRTYPEVGAEDGDDVHLLVGYTSSEGNPRIQLYRMQGQSDEAPSIQPLPSPIDLIEGQDALDPVWLHRSWQVGRAPVQMDEAGRVRLAFDQADNLVWREALLTPNPARTEYTPANFHVYTSAPIEPIPDRDEATGWWAIDVRGDDNYYNLWSTEPLVTYQGTVVAWSAIQAPYSDDLLFIASTDLDGRAWRLISRRLRCLDPR